MPVVPFFENQTAAHRDDNTLCILCASVANKQLKQSLYFF